MNKKNLSVVMAGAMLATSVAPVLAAETTNTYEVTSGNVGLLIDKLDTLFATCEKFTDDTDKLKDDTLAEQPVLAFQFREVGTTDWTIDGVKEDSKGNGSTDTEILKSLSSEKDYELRVIDRGYTKDDDGDIIDCENSEATIKTYESADISALATALNTKVPGTDTVTTSNINSKDIFTGFDTLFKGDGANTNVITKVVDGDGNTSNGGSFDSSATTLKITLASGTVLTLTEGNFVYDFQSATPYDSRLDTDKDGKIGYAEATASEDAAKSITGFNKLTEAVTSEDIESTVKYTVKIVAGDLKSEYKVTDLYDGFMLTEEGHNLLNEMNTVKAKAKVKPEKYDVAVYDVKADTKVENYSFKVRIDDNGTIKLVTVNATKAEKAKIDMLHKWLKAGYADVDILAGSNRYATAVEIAKTFVNTTNQYKPNESKDEQPSSAEVALEDIVLVNGEALVDGLAAAPYAHALNQANGAPILLTPDNKLAKETKDYLKELVANYKVNNLPTVHIVGGEAVVSNTVVEELKDMGFKVKRIAGDNREETSLAVADKLREVNSNNYGEAFVVGADGEADAMSIASYAAASETPIIVSKSAKGLSTVGLNEISNYDKVTIIGGEGAVSNADEEAIKELVDNEENVTRIAGATRFETNAEVIKTYHKGYTNVLVAKDGQKKESELVDALAVSIFASANTNDASATTAAPIVLATSKLSDAQLNQVVLKVDKKNTKTVYQIGGGVDRSVMEKIVTKMGLNR